MSATYFPPVPKWQPAFGQPLDEVIKRFRYYSDRKLDLVFFQHGTCAAFSPGRDEADLHLAATTALGDVFRAHPDMNPIDMNDGNMLITYSGGIVANVVIRAFADDHWAEIDANHVDAIAEFEVLITPLGHNKFDDRGKRALFGRCFMFMDAQQPQIVRTVRAEAQ